MEYDDLILPENEYCPEEILVKHQRAQASESTILDPEHSIVQKTHAATPSQHQRTKVSTTYDTEVSSMPAYDRTQWKSSAPKSECATLASRHFSPFSKSNEVDSELSFSPYPAVTLFRNYSPYCEEKIDGRSARRSCEHPKNRFNSTNNSKRRVHTMLFWKRRLGISFPVTDTMLRDGVWRNLESCKFGIK